MKEEQRARCRRGAMAAVMRVVLDEPAFRDLVAGKVVDLGEVQLVLSDIGWNRQLCALLDALAGAPRRPRDPPQAAEFLPVKKRRR